MKCDVSDEEQVKTLVAQTVERFGQIDILVNNAALYATLTPRSFSEWDAGAVGSRDGDQRARALSDGPSCRAAHDRAPHRQDHQHRLGRTPTKACRACCLTSPPRAPCLPSPARCRASSANTASRSIRCRLAISSATPDCRTRSMSRTSASRCATRAPSSATPIRKTCSARWCSWPQRQRFRHRPVDRGGRWSGQ